jgi:hypothetical protein
MNPLPLPVRIAAGLVATAVEQARDLPRQVVEFPVTAISQALQASMRVQQKITELAIKGDRALGALRPAEETPAWATFDDEEPPRRNGASTVTELRPQTTRPTPPRRSTTAEGTTATEPAPTSKARPTSTPAPTSKAAEVAARTTAAAAAGEQPPVTGPEADDASGPNLLPGYQEMTIPQLRARLRKLSVADLRTLLAWETAHDDRPPFVTMLTNRITTVTQG